ncbi:MAG: hypothetical protein JSS27_19315 [Planctomycetes bacterium]|nr:hypothetical protein [Planctomycetota bacterium]
MNLRTLLLGATLAIMFTVAAADSAQAQWGYAGFGYGTAYNGAWVNERLPFYSQYSPVYYGHPTARPYGYSPFAYTAFTPTPQATAAVSPRVIYNPYVETSPAPEAPRPQPLTIKNPYVVDAAPAPRIRPLPSP